MPTYYTITDLLGNTHKQLGDVHNYMKDPLINSRQTGGKTLGCPVYE